MHRVAAVVIIAGFVHDRSSTFVCHYGYSYSSITTKCIVITTARLVHLSSCATHLGAPMPS